MTAPTQQYRTAAEKWAGDLAAWQIPGEILAAAPQPPWIHPVALFEVADGPTPGTPSHAKARERLEANSSVLDVGCGGGRAAFALAPPAVHVIGVDHQQGMLGAFATALNAHARRRVVLELPQRHPLAGMAPLWLHFWGLERPGGPTVDRRRSCRGCRHSFCR